ncbi:MAG: hypothetical protein AAGK66_07310 [Pseudomonadota bacterium]
MGIIQTSAEAADCETIQEFLDFLGRDDVARACSVKRNTVDTIIWRSAKIPANWFAAIEEMCVERRRGCPRHFFAFDRRKGAPKSYKEDGAR